jgi:hypothetical protein
MSDKEKGTSPSEPRRSSVCPPPSKKARVDDNAIIPPPLPHVAGEEEEEEEEESSDDDYDYGDGEEFESTNSDSSVCADSDSDFDGLGNEDEIEEMPEGIEKYHYLQLSIKRSIRELQAKRKALLETRDELISQEALKFIPRWVKRLNKFYRFQMKFNSEVSDEKTLRAFYKNMYQEKRYNFIWTLHIERFKIWDKKYNFYTKAGEYTDGAKFVNVVMQKSKYSKITSSNWDAAVLITQKESPELFETSRESKLNLCRKVLKSFAEFASICDIKVLYTEY